MSKSMYSLTNPQKSIWLTEQFYKGTSIENIAGTATILEKVDFKKFEKAINLFIEKNDSFRLKFVFEDNEVKQYVEDYSYFSFEKFSVSSEQDIKKIEKELSNIVFNTLNSFLFEFKFFEFPDGHGGFVICMHHLISDAWSCGIIISEIINIYDSLLNNEEISSVKSPSYIDYIVSEKEYINSEKFEKDKLFWNDLFETIPETATIPSRNSNSILSSAAKRKQFILNKEMLSSIKAFCKSNKISEFNFFMGILSLYISRVSSLNDFVIGTPILNRSNFKEKHTVGMFISVVPFKVSLNSENTFVEFSSTISKNFFSIFKHQKYSYQDLLEDLRRKNENAIPNLFNIMFSYQNMRSNKQTAKTNYDSKWLFNNNISDDLDIHLYDINDTGNVIMAYDYKTDKYSIEEIYSIHERFLHIINQILQNTNIVLKDIEIVTPEEKRKLLYDFNNTKTAYPKDKTVIQLFEEQVEKTPNNIAVVFEDKSLTYKELNEKANSLAHHLRENNISRNDIVGIMVNRSLEMIISILAVLKSGACYIPIDPEYPQDRIEYMLENSNAKKLLTFEKLQNKVNFENKIFVELTNKLYDSNKNNLENINEPDDLAYIIYTSGSTGMPKGVMLIHKSLSNLTNYCNRYIKYLKDTKYRTIVSITTISFDIFIFETLISLQKGLKLVIANEAEQTIPRLLSDLIQKHNIEIIQTTPSRMQLLVNNINDILNLSNLKFVTLAGEQLPLSLVNDLKKIGSPVIYNGYGPSETTVFSTLTDVTNHTTITIGKPLDNTQIYVLNSDLNICPMDVPGEIYISGDGVGLGYMDNLTLTKKSYLPNIFSKEDKVLYKTGDLGFYRTDGEIICLGRADNQVKIRGLRIELEEIENEILKNDNINNCVVVKRISEDNHEFLCAYYTASNKVDVSSIRESLQKSLPNYMIPQYFMELTNLPYTPNGKIDRKRLPTPIVESQNKEIFLPRNEIDRKIVDILRELLNIENISITDSFFELGGDSLTAINFCTKIYSELNVQLFVKDILENPIISNLSDLLTSKSIVETNTPPIEKNRKRSYYPVSSAQSRMYYASSISGDSILYNISGGLILDSIPNISKLKNAFNELIKRHSSLRTYFEILDDKVVQKIDDNIKFELGTGDSIIKESEIDDAFSNFNTPFDLSKAPLFKAKLLELDNKKCFLMISMHHIISDGASLSIIAQDLCKLYNGEKLSNIKIDYKDFSLWENQNLSNNSFKAAEEFWINQFNDEIPILNMPTKPRPAIQSFEGSKVYSKISKLNTEKLNTLAKDLGITPYMLFLGAYYILLYKYTSQNDIIVGSPIVGRNSSDLYNVVGMFVNTLPIRAKIDSNSSFKDFINNIKDICLENYKYQDYPFDELVSKLNLTRDTSRNPLFDTMFIYQNNGYLPATFDGINSEYYIPNTKISKFDLSLEIIPNNNSLDLSFEYCTKLFNKSFIENLSNHYLNILNAILENNKIKITEIDMLSKEEKHKILYDFNNTKMDYPKNKTIVDLFEEQVEKTPNSIAVVFENQTLTYKELNEKANSLAHYLVKLGIKNGTVVPVLLNRSIDLIISMLSIIKVGASYLPLSTEYPADRLNYITENSKSKFIITNSSTEINFLKNDLTVINIDTFNFNSCSNKNISVNISPDDVLYVIYTSGSTGNPKGVEVMHKNLNNFIHSFNKLFKNISPKDKLLASTNICFDVSIFEFYISLLNGSSLYLYEENTISDIFNYCDSIIKNNITMLYIPPNILEEVYTILSKHNYNGLDKLLIGVEPIKTETIKKYYKLNPNIKIINGYGPTETTICATAFDLSESSYSNYKTIPIGKPLSNLDLYVLDNSNNPVPVGVLGELYIAGDNVSKGYLFNKDLTNKAFMKIPKITSETLYKTGDLVKWNEDGNISFVGRNDSQIKLHGHRIELGEINNSIKQISGIKNSVTIIKNINNIPSICSYVVTAQDVEISYIKSLLKKTLPFYMVPSYIINIDAIPVTVNGKIDVNSLPEITLNKNQNVELASSELERKISSIILKILNVDCKDINTDFFEIGLDSLYAIRLAAELYNLFGIKISSQEIFQNSTIKELACYISSKSNLANDKIVIKKTNKKAFYNVSSAQKRIYYASKMSGDSSTLYNIPSGIIFDKSLDVKKLEFCINTLINRHESLRTYFEIGDDDNLVQKIQDEVNFKLTVAENILNEESLKNEFDNFVTPFELSKAPLFRAELIKLDNNQDALFVDMHHIISDGTSISILINELCKLYNDEQLDNLKITYKDYVEWEKAKLNSGEYKDAEEFWVNQFKNDIPVLNMPTNFPRPAIKSYDGNKFNSKIDEQATNKINTICKQEGITPYMLLLGVYYVLLSKYTGQEDIIIGSPIVGRSLSELYNIIGMFVNTLPIRAKIDSNSSFKDFINNIKNICLENYKYQDYPFDELVNALKIQRDTSRNPLFDTMFIYQNNGVSSVDFAGLNSKYYVPNNRISKFDLSLEIVPNNGSLDLSLEYCTKLFNKSFIENLSNHYLNILNAILENIDVKIANINMLSKEEKNKIIYKFNDTEMNYPKDKTIAKLFEEQAQKNPNNIALIFEDKKLTYKELNEKANSLAHYLRSYGIGRNDIVGIMVNRSLEMIVGILGVLKSGGAYIPIDPEYPEDRIQYMLENSNAKLLLTQEKLENSISYKNKKCIDLSVSELYNENTSNLENINKPDDLCYIIYTSGSTGLPKGVCLKNINIVNFIFAILKEINFNSNETIVSITTISFDIFVLESLLPLLNGMKIVIAPEEAQTDAKYFSDLCKTNKVDIIQTTPSRMQAYLFDENIATFISKIKYLLIGGEPFPPQLLKKLHTIYNGKIYNMYGPTETAVWSSIKDLSNTEKITIGKPIGNTQLYVLDSFKNPLPSGVPGELFISGDGVCKGYFNNSDLTSKAFIDNPFIPNSIMYKTGDLCMMLPNGEIQYLERIDNQVKIRGLRIELGEIEARISSYPNIQKSCVIKQTINNRDFISAYFTVNKRINISELRKYLSGILPNYMVPSYYTVLDEFPYTPNGKINKKVLPLPKEILGSTEANTYEAPKTALEKKLVSTWEKILNTSPIGINDNFFELGGDSILAMNLNIELKNIVDNISYSDIFKFPTISELIQKSKTSDEDYDFNYMEKNYDKYNDLLKLNIKVPRIFDLKYTNSGNILLTGATGFLGMHILDSFIKKEKGNVYCIIREDSGLTAQTRLHQKLNYYFGKKYDKLIGKRIFAITGDICKSGFGLNQDELLNLANNVDIVINTAARVAHYGNYSDFYNANVKSVQYMIDFSKSFNKRFYHISTLSISGNALESSGIKQNISKTTYFNESNLYIGQSLENVYIRSKFEAECLVLDSILNGLDAYILRVGNLMPRLKDGMFQENAVENAFINRISSFIKIGSIPEYIINNYLEFTPIDITANSIIKLITHPNSNNRIFHLFNNNHIYIYECIKYFKILNPDLKILNDNDFRKLIKSMLNSKKKKEILGSLINDLDNDLHFVYETDIIIKSDTTIKYLSKIGFSWPKISNKYIMRFLEILRRII